AASTTGFPVRSGLPLTGAMSVTTGGTFGVRIVIVRTAWPTRPPRSLADAVIVWTPAERREVAKLGPEPIRPSRSDIQRRFAESVPSVASIAVPAKLTLAPWKTRV